MDPKQQNSNSGGNSGSKMIIGCRLPNGIILDHPNNPLIRVTLDGVNKTLVRGVGRSAYGITRVDRDFWEAWKKKHADFAPLKNGAIFEAGSENEAKAVFRDVQDIPTGLEPMKKDGKDKRAAGVKARDDKQPAAEE